LKKISIKTVLDLLQKQYGQRSSVPSHDPLSELVQTILSQNTSDINSRPAFKALKSTFGDWENILQARTSEIAEVIKSGGLAKIKAERIQQALQKIKERQGKIDLSVLNDLPVPEARQWLKGLPGVGNKTANCVLLFALGKPALPVDTHIYRVSGRLGLISKKTSLDEAHRLLEAIVPQTNIYEFHVLMIEHGRKACIAQRPRCPQCVLKMVCPGFKIYTGHSAKNHERA
jgi:endonuclease III